MVLQVAGKLVDALIAVLMAAILPTVGSAAGFLEEPVTAAAGRFMAFKRRMALHRLGGGVAE